MGHSRTPTQNTAGDGFAASPIDGCVRLHQGPLSHQVIELAAAGQLGLAAAGQIHHLTTDNDELESGRRRAPIGSAVTRT
jgi:hypothetical protein